MWIQTARIQLIYIQIEIFGAAHSITINFKLHTLPAGLSFSPLKISASHIKHVRYIIAISDNRKMRSASGAIRIMEDVKIN